MTTTTLTINEFTNFSKLAKKAKQIYSYVVENGAVIITANTLYLKSLGY